MPLDSLNINDQFIRMRQILSSGLQNVLKGGNKEYDIRTDEIIIDANIDQSDFISQKEAKYSGATWGVPVVWKGSLLDKQGNVLKTKKFKLFDLPVLTPRMSYIVDGKEFQIMNQLRLRPGVYTRVKNNGEIESVFNLSRGLNFKITLDPEKLKYNVEFGTTNTNLYPILKVLGAHDTQIKETLGDEVFSANTQNIKYGYEVNRLHKLLLRKEAPEDLNEAEKNLQNYFKTTGLDPATTEITLGKAYKNIDSEVLLTTAKKLIDVNKGKVASDDRDEIRFKRLFTPDDLLEQRITKNANLFSTYISNKLNSTRDLRQVINPIKIEKIIKSLFNQSTLAHTPEQINPIEMLSNFGKTSIFGEGGILDKRAVTINTRNITPTQFGFVDPIHTPEGEQIGVSGHIALGVRKLGENMITQVLDLKTHKPKDLNPIDAYNLKIAFPDQYKKIGENFLPIEKQIKVFYKGKVLTVPTEEVDAVLPSSLLLFDFSTNSLPFLNSLQGARAMMAAKHQEQALSLKNREAPLVKVKVGEDLTMDEFLGGISQTISTPISGTIKKISDNYITVEDSKGEAHKQQIYNNFPLNSKSYLQSEPLVKEGDKVKAGQIIADSNYTKDGNIALGINLTAAYLPAKGFNYEDGLVISQKASKKLTSNHLYQYTIEVDKETILDKNLWQQYYGQLFIKIQLEKLDNRGIIKKGEKLIIGDPIAVVLKKRILTPEDVLLASFKKSLARPYQNILYEWKESIDGEVVDIIPEEGTEGKFFHILIKTEEPAVVGDKLSSRHAAKGIITKIIPDNEMPHTADGEPVDILINPLGLPSRINPSQILELAAAKVAKKRGKPFLVENFRPQEKDNITDVKRALVRYEVSEKEELFDPINNRSLGLVAVGPKYILKLDHPVRKKFSARSTGPGNPYTSELTPSQGEAKSAQSLDPLTLYSIMAHGGKENLYEMATYKASRNPEFWRTYMATGDFIPPEQGLPWEKFTAYMKGMGVNIKKENSELRLAPMTDKEIKAISNGEINNASMLIAKNLKPEAGGLFDPIITGGLRGPDGLPGGKWSHITLSISIPNPVFEKAITTLLDIPVSVYEDIIQGKKSVSKTGEILETSEGFIAGSGIKKLLDQIDPEKELQKLRENAKKITDEGVLNKYNKKIRFLDNWVKTGMSSDNFILKHLPIVPPKFRPIYPLDSGDLITSGLNYLYKDTILLNQEVERSKELPESRQQDKRMDLYKAAGAVMGLNEPIMQKSRQYKGIFEQLKGEDPKHGWYQSRLVKRRQDLTGRSTITTEPTLHLDEVGLPETMAWKIFEPFVIRNLVSRGLNLVQAKKEIMDKSIRAKEALQDTVDEKYVFLNRAPSLHKHSFLAHKPILISGKSIQLHPLVLAGYGADIDGDTMAVHVPISDNANEEAKKMLPSRNMFTTKGGFLLTPNMEMQIGLYLITKGDKKTDKSFNTKEEAKEALNLRQIEVTDLIKIKNKETTIGRILVNEVLPPSLQKDDIVLDKKTLNIMLSGLAKNNPIQTPAVVDALKDLGNKYSFDLGFTVGVDDLLMDITKRDKIFVDADKEADKISHLPQEKHDKKIIEIYSNARDKLNETMKESLKERGSSLYAMAVSGARGNWDQVRQIAAAPVLYADAYGRTIPSPIKKSFSEGLDIADYWSSLYGSRSGMIEKGIQTAEPGALNKSIIGTTINNIITMLDCGTTRGKKFDINDINIIGRFLLDPVSDFSKNTLLTDEIVSRIRSDKVKFVTVRTPLYCLAPIGTCVRCYGSDEKGNVITKGTNIGILAGQSLTEPLTQLSMKAWHTGGVAKSEKDVTDSFTLIKQLFEYPQVFKNRAPLAKISGKVKEIEELPAGGWNVSISNEDHFVPAARDLKVKKGDSVVKGDQLSDGLKDPRELLNLRGPWETREYIADTLKDIYSSSGLNVSSRHFETVARSVAGSTRILQGDEEGEFLEGDIAPLDTVIDYNLKNVSTTLAKNALGHALAEDIKDLGGLGKILTEKDLEELAKKGIEKIKTNSNPLVHSPVLKGVSIIPRTRRDWMSHLAFRYMKEVADRGIAEGWKSDISGFNPLPAQIYGKLRM